MDNENARTKNDEMDAIHSRDKKILMLESQHELQIKLNQIEMLRYSEEITAKYYDIMEEHGQLVSD